jgi:hypothetical protein
MAQITLTRALVEIKTLEARIATATAQQFIGITKGKDEKPTVGKYQKKEDVIKATTSAFQTVNDLITRRTKLKKALVEANTNTQVKVGNSVMSIADAIDAKNIATFKARLVEQIRHQISSASNVIEQNRIKMEAEIQSQVDRILGNDAKLKDAAEQNKTMIETIRSTMFDMHDMKIVDPNNLILGIEKMQAELQSFVDEIDFTLSEVNAKTTINVDD